MICIYYYVRIISSLRKNRSEFVPPRNRNACLEKYIQSIEDFPLEPQNNKTKPKLTKMENETIKHLANDNSVVIKEADKGGATIIMNQANYKKYGRKHFD